MCLSIFYTKFVEYLVSSNKKNKQPQIKIKLSVVNCNNTLIILKAIDLKSPPVMAKNRLLKYRLIIPYIKVIFKTSHDIFQIKKAYRKGTLKLLNLLNYTLFLETTATPTRATTAARIAMPAMSAV